MAAEKELVILINIEQYDLKQKQMNAICDDELLGIVQKQIVSYETIAPHLGINSVQVRVIEKDHNGYELQKLKILEKWRKSKGTKATYFALAKAFLEIEEKDVAECILDYVKRNSTLQSDDFKKSMMLAQSQRIDELTMKTQENDSMMQLLTDQILDILSPRKDMGSKTKKNITQLLKMLREDMKLLKQNEQQSRALLKEKKESIEELNKKIIQLRNDYEQKIKLNDELKKREFSALAKLQEKESQIRLLQNRIGEMESQIEALQKEKLQLKEKYDKADANAIKEAREISILVIGKPGVGKSALTNAVLADDVHEERAGANPVTINKIQNTVRKYGEVGFNVYDTRGLCDGQVDDNDILDAIKKAKPGCDYDVVVVCVRLTDGLDIVHKRVLRALNHMKCDIWPKVHIALTYSDIRDHSPQTDDEFAEDATKALERDINRFLSALHVSTIVPVHNTSHIKKNSNIRVLRNWLPRFILKLLCSQELFTFQTVLTMATSHPYAGPAVKRAIAIACGRNATDIANLEDLQEISKKGYSQCQNLCKILNELEPESVEPLRADDEEAEGCEEITEGSQQENFTEKCKSRRFSRCRTM